MSAIPRTALKPEHLPKMETVLHIEYDAKWLGPVSTEFKLNFQATSVLSFSNLNTACILEQQTKIERA